MKITVNIKMNRDHSKIPRKNLSGIKFTLKAANQFRILRNGRPIKNLKLNLNSKTLRKESKIWRKEVSANLLFPQIKERSKLNKPNREKSESKAFSPIMSPRTTNIIKKTISPTVKPNKRDNNRRGVNNTARKIITRNKTKKRSNGGILNLDRFRVFSPSIRANPNIFEDCIRSPASRRYEQQFDPFDDSNFLSESSKIRFKLLNIGGDNKLTLPEDLKHKRRNLDLENFSTMIAQEVNSMESSQSSTHQYTNDE